MKILLVDDDQDDQYLFQEVIRSIDPSIVCETAGDGEEAIKILSTAAEKPDLVFLDINMPRMDGRTCLKIIRELIAQLPVVIVSTSISIQDKIFFELHNAKFIKKPNEYNELVSLIKRHIPVPKGENRWPNYG